MSCEIISEVVEVKTKRLTFAAGRHRCFQKVERALYVGGDEFRTRVRLDVGFVKCAGMHDRLNFEFSKRGVDQVAVGNRADHCRQGRSNWIEANDVMPVALEAGHKGLPEPA